VHCEPAGVMILQIHKAVPPEERLAAFSGDLLMAGFYRVGTFCGFSRLARLAMVMCREVHRCNGYITA
jgi:hypothetical protein